MRRLRRHHLLVGLAALLHPTAFFAGLLRHQPMGFYPKHVVVNDAQRAGVKFLPIDLRHSQAQIVVQGNAIRLSLSDVHGFSPEQSRSSRRSASAGRFARCPIW